MFSSFIKNIVQSLVFVIYRVLNSLNQIISIQFFRASISLKQLSRYCIFDGRRNVIYANIRLPRDEFLLKISFVL